MVVLMVVVLPAALKLRPEAAAQPLPTTGAAHRGLPPRVPRDQALLDAILKRGPEGVDEAIEMLDYYGMSREDLFDSLHELQMPNLPKYRGLFTDKFAALTSQMKSNFTRKYNKQAHMAQHLVAEQSVGKGKRGKKRAAVDAGEDDEDEEEMDDADAIAQFKSKKKRKAPAKKPKGKGKGKKKAAA